MSTHFCRVISHFCAAFQGPGSVEFHVIKRSWSQEERREKKALASMMTNVECAVEPERKTWEMSGLFVVSRIWGISPSFYGSILGPFFCIKLTQFPWFYAISLLLDFHFRVVFLLLFVKVLNETILRYFDELLTNIWSILDLFLVNIRLFQ